MVALSCAAGARAAAITPTDSPVDVAFLGDSYTFGVGASEPTDGYAYLVAKHENWTARVVGLPGSGYVRVAIRDDKNIAAGINYTAGHPNDLGYAHIARLLEADLQTLGVH
jgi:lysophospholipase L1-like esterase